MQAPNRRYLVLLLLAVVLLLGVTVSGLAQSATPSPTATAQPVEPAPTEAADVTTPVTTVVTAPLILTPTQSVTPTVTVSLPITVGAELTVTVPLTLSEVLTATVAELAVAVPVTTSAVLTATPGIELTVYNQDLGLVKEVRTLQLLSGTNTLRFSDVASAIEPTSVQVRSLSDPQGMTVLEQDYEYDLVSSYQLLRKYVDQRIGLLTKSGAVYSGTLLSGVDDIILATDLGIAVVARDQVQELSFPALPEGLITRPTLVWLLQAAQDGPQDVQVTYLTGGLSWQADYNLLYAPEDDELALTGWVSLNNQSGATYRDAKLKLVAGDVHRVTAGGAVPELLNGAVLRATAQPAVTERPFFEYHIYQVQRPVTVRDKQTKQIAFVTASAVNADKVLVYDAAPQPLVGRGGAVTDPSYGAVSDAKVRVQLEFENTEGSGLGVPLPEGIMRVYQQDADGSGAELVGEDQIDHTPRGARVALYLGDAFDVVGERQQLSLVQLGERSLEESYQITLRNHKPEAVTVRVIEHLFRAQDATVLSSSMDYEMPDATTLRYQVPVAADAQAVLSYTVRYKW
jgi:hypothetical protein